MPEGTISRLATRRVLETLQPERTVTICLPLFLAGGEGERAFARHYPTIAIDGCEKRCAARGTEMYSGKPAASIVVSELSSRSEVMSWERRGGFRTRDVSWWRRLPSPQASSLTACLEPENPGGSQDSAPSPAKTVVTCSCGSGIPVKKLTIAGRETEVAALPVIYQSWRDAGRMPDQGISSEMLKTLKVYNPIPEDEEDAWKQAIALDYARFCSEKK